MTRMWLNAGLLLLALLALPAAATLAAAQETTPEPPKSEEPKPDEAKAEAGTPPEAAPAGGTEWTLKAGEDGISIAQGEHFSLQAHVLLQPQLTREHLTVDFDGGLYDWFNALDPLTQQPNTIPNRKNTSYPYDDSFSLLRARMILEGHVFADWIGYKFEGEFGEGKGELLDAYVRLGDEKKIYGLVGQFRAPFDFFTNVEEFKQLFPSFSGAAEAVDPTYAPGVMGVGRFWDSRFVASLALQDSEAQGTRVSGDDDRPQIAARVEFQNKGGFDYDLTGLSKPTDIQYTLGFAYVDNDNGGEIDTETGMLCLDGLSSECDSNPYSMRGWEGFFAIRGSALTFALSYQDLEWEDGGSWSNTDLPEAPNQIPAGAVTTFRRNAPFSVLQAEIGVFVAPKAQIAARWASISFDEPTLIPLPYGPPALTPDDPGQPVNFALPNLVTVQEDYEEWGIAFNYYLRKNNLKIMAGWENRKATDEVQDVYYSYVPSNVASTDYFDYQRRTGKIDRRNPLWYLMLSFYL
jgi:hypothetical protein